MMQERVYLPPPIVVNYKRFYGQKNPLDKGKYSLDNIYRLSVDCEIMMKYLRQGIVTKIRIPDVL